MSTNPINALKITIHNTKHKQKIQQCISKNRIFSKTEIETMITYLYFIISNFHNSNSIYIVYFPSTLSPPLPTHPPHHPSTRTTSPMYIHKTTFPDKFDAITIGHEELGVVVCLEITEEIYNVAHSDD